MNPIVLNIADGTTFFVGLALVLAAETILIRLGSRIARAILTLLAITGIILVVISATPLPIWMYLFWTIPAIAGLIPPDGTFPARKFRIISNSVLLFATVALCVAEAPHRRCPGLVVPKGTIIYVLGDSISSGIGMEQRSWPDVLEGMIPFRVVSLAQPGSTVKSAILRATDITVPRSLIIVEIGGNDLLGKTDAATFRSDLENLVSALCSDHHQVLLLELPLFPFRNAYGMAQRDIVAKYGIAMLPKRCFAQVLGTENGTLDGLHLSQAGHDEMARIIAGVIQQQ